jgi:hypothetical protein
MLSVVMLSVVAPFSCVSFFFYFYFNGEATKSVNKMLNDDSKLAQYLLG